MTQGLCIIRKNNSALHAFWNRKEGKL